MENYLQHAFQRAVAKVVKLCCHPRAVVTKNPGYVTATSTRGKSNSFPISTPMAILVSLGCLLVFLVALFVHSSKPKQQSKSAKAQICEHPKQQRLVSTTTAAAAAAAGTSPVSEQSFVSPSSASARNTATTPNQRPVWI